MYALVEYKGKQYKAEKDALIAVDKIDLEEGKTLDIDTVLLLNDGKKVSVGAPYVKGATVTATVEKQGKARKIIVFKYKPKKGEKTKKGHRQAYTKVQIEKINA